MFKRPEEPFKVLKIHNSHKIYLDAYIQGHRIKKSTGLERRPDQFNREDQVVRRNHPDRDVANKLLRGFQDRLEFIYQPIEIIRRPSSLKK